jgi:hypothetical protein
MAWVSLIVVLAGSISVSGTDGGDGWISVGIGVAAALIVALAWNRKAPLWLAALPGGVGIAMMVYEALHISSRISRVNASRYAHAKVGDGVWVCLAGAIILLICGLQAAINSVLEREPVRGG